mmetsp:Transcript_36368/g.85365  ORF Transcript_36368/g.85365 Transcript_36368/m.85365 type:complete len:212 (-) Transcript_36368:180-815(-)
MAGSVDGLGVGASGSASSIEVPLLDARERVAATLHVTAQSAFDAPVEGLSTSLAGTLPSAEIMKVRGPEGLEEGGAEYELSQLKASHEALLRVHVALQAEVRRARHQGGSGAVSESLLKAHGGSSRHDTLQDGGDWRSQPLPALRKTVEILDSARHNWRNERSLVEEAHGFAANAFRQLAHYNAHGVQLSGQGLPRDVRATVGAQRASMIV